MSERSCKNTLIETFFYRAKYTNDWFLKTCFKLSSHNKTRFIILENYLYKLRTVKKTVNAIVVVCLNCYVSNFQERGGESQVSLQSHTWHSSRLLVSQGMNLTNTSRPADYLDDHYGESVTSQYATDCSILVKLKLVFMIIWIIPYRLSCFIKSNYESLSCICFLFSDILLVTANPMQNVYCSNIKLLFYVLPWIKAGTRSPTNSVLTVWPPISHRDYNAHRKNEKITNI